MSADANSMSEPLRHDGFSPADSLHSLGHGSAPGESPRPVQWGSLARNSLSGFAPTPDETTRGYAAAELCRVAGMIDYARDEKDLSAATRAAFGPESFSRGFIEAQSGRPDTKHYLELQRQMVRAELQDYLGGSLKWPVGKKSGSDFMGLELWQLGHHLRFMRINLLCNDTVLKKAADYRDALLIELTQLFSPNASDGWAGVRAKIRPETQEDWDRFTTQTRVVPPPHHGETGGLLGKVMLAVLPLFAAEKAIVAPAAKHAAFAGGSRSTTPAGPA